MVIFKRPAHPIKSVKSLKSDVKKYLNTEGAIFSLLINHHALESGFIKNGKASFKPQTIKNNPAHATVTTSYLGFCPDCLWCDLRHRPSHTNQKITSGVLKHAIPQTAKQIAAKKAPRTVEARTSATGESVWKKHISRNQTFEISADGYETAYVTLPKFKIGKSHTLEVRLTPLAAQ